ncbi:MAG: LTA synthase family protein [Plesiomonas sp.]
MHSHTEYKNKSIVLFRTIWVQIIYLIAILLGARYAMFLAFTAPDTLADKAQDIQRLWVTGLRFDLRIAAIASAPVLLLGFFLAIKESCWQTFIRIVPVIFGLLSFLVSAIAIGNYYYYQTYHTFIDVFAFGLFDDDTPAVLSNMWQDYPILQSVFIACIAAWLAYILSRKVINSALIKKKTKIQEYGYLVFCIFLFFVFCRGSIGPFPLRRDNAQVSSLNVLNKLVPNGVIAIDWALKDRKSDVSFEPVTLQQGVTLKQQLQFDDLHTKTPVNNWLDTHKPNVVFALMESFGSNMLAFDKLPENDLLGNLREHFNSDFLFRKFLSEDNGTAPSFAALFFQSPVQNISHSSAQNIKLRDTPFSIYKSKGYKTIFISPGNMMWRNLINYLPTQGVDEVYDQNTLMKMYPEAEKEITAWGVPDEYAYKLATKLLNENKENPLFISILSITNHPPYVVPARYNIKPISEVPEFLKHAEEGGIDQINMLKTYQYAADSLGNFITGIKESENGDRTLIAATGDHQMRRVKAFYPIEQVLDRAVPFYLYVPKPILDHVEWRFDANRVGSHKDIMPTLYSYSLSNTSYLALAGRNLLSPIDDEKRAFGYNVTLWIDDKGAYPLTGKPVFYSWANAEGIKLNSDVKEVSTQQQERMKALPELLRWQLNGRLKGFIDSNKAN